MCSAAVERNPAYTPGKISHQVAYDYETDSYLLQSLSCPWSHRRSAPLPRFVSILSNTAVFRSAHISTSNNLKLTLKRFVSLDPTTLAISLKRRNRGMVCSHAATLTNISNMLINNQISIFVPYVPSQQLNRCSFHMSQ